MRRRDRIIGRVGEAFIALAILLDVVAIMLIVCGVR